MRDQRDQGVSRRELLGGLTLVASVGFLGVHPESATAEPPPETTRIRLAHHPAIGTAPYFLAKEFLPAEGFTDVQDVKTQSTLSIKAVVAGEVDIALNFSGPLSTRVDAGDPLVILAGIHVGCFQLFGGERVRTIRDLKGKTVALFNDFGGPEHVCLASMAAHVGHCAREPERVARFFVDEGYAERYDYTLQTLQEIPYNRWREYDPEDTVRFHALRLHEAGMVKTSLQEIIAQGTDWRFLNELKKELKG